MNIHVNPEDRIKNDNIALNEATDKAFEEGNGTIPDAKARLRKMLNRDPILFKAAADRGLEAVIEDLCHQRVARERQWSAVEYDPERHRSCGERLARAERTSWLTWPLPFLSIRFGDARRDELYESAARTGKQRRTMQIDEEFLRMAAAGLPSAEVTAREVYDESAIAALRKRAETKIKPPKTVAAAT